MNTHLFILISNDQGQLEVDGRLDLFDEFMSVLLGKEHDWRTRQIVSEDFIQNSPDTDGKKVKHGG